MTHVSSELGLNIVFHSDIDFVDTIERDIKLFIDPCLISLCEDEMSLEARRTIDSYYDKLFELYKHNGSLDEKRALFAHHSENNATKLGYGNGRNGHCKTVDCMIETFRDITHYFDSGIILTHPMDTALLVDGYAEDCLSDTLTNIMFNVLNNYTIDVCNRYGRELGFTEGEYYYWDYNLNNWVSYQGPCLRRSTNNEVILLVPKRYVRKKFFYNVGHFIRMIIFVRIISEQTFYDNKGQPHGPTKKELSRRYLVNRDSKLSFALDYLLNYPDALTEYNDRVAEFYQNRNMSDEALDRFVYGNQR